MPSIFNFKLNPLSIALKTNAISLFVLMAGVAEARVVTKPDETVRPGPAPDSFELRAGSGLTVEGATTKNIRAQSATLIVMPGSKTEDITAFHSNVQLNGAEVVARQGQPAALFMSGGTALINNSTLIHTSGIGLVVSRPGGGGDGNGTYVMHTDFSNGQTDFLNVEGKAEGNHSLLLAATGSELSNAQPVHVVHTEGGDGKFTLLGDTVDVGAYSYGLKQEGTDWFLDPTRRGTSTSAQSVLALFNSAPTVLYGEMSILRTRMGELRFSDGQSNGLWMRSYGNKFEVAGNKNGAGYSQIQKGFTIGADTPLSGGDGQWLAGVMAGHSTSDLSLTRGSKGEVKSYYLGAYATWLDDESGLYFDGVAKLNRLHNDVNVTMSDGKRAKGNYTQNAVGASAEVGRHIKLDDGYFVEPYSQLSATITQAQSYELDNGLNAKGDRSASVVGKVGVTTGKNIQLDSGGVLQPYLRTALAHEFNHSNKVNINDQTFNNDVFGSRIEVAAGVAVSMSKNLKLHADFEHSRGKKIDQPWGVNVGVRYDF